MSKSNSKPSKKPASSVIARNKKAYHQYEVMEEFKAGIVLMGSEMKSIRQGKVIMNQGFAKVNNGEVFLYGVHIAPYSDASYNNHDPDRVRKLLLNKREINKLVGKMKEKGLTLVPLKMFFDRCWVKVNLGLCKGKQLHDKRRDIAEKSAKRDIQRAIKLKNR